MVIYFSGTGNSKYVAKQIADKTNDDIFCINDAIKNKTDCNFSKIKKLIFVTPTYAWRIPRVVSDWITNTVFKQTALAWFVMTCGSETGNAAKYNSLLCDNKQFVYMGTMQIVMPENYIAMFNAPEWDEAKEIIEKAEPSIEKASECIEINKKFAKSRCNIAGRISSSVVNPVFYKLFVKAKPFYAKSECIGCGKCVNVCPLNNIVLENGKPKWKGNCTQCMACICYCPKEAIEYGHKSKGKPRYKCIKLTEDK